MLFFALYKLKTSLDSTSKYQISLPNLPTESLVLDKKGTGTGYGDSSQYDLSIFPTESKVMIQFTLTACNSSTIYNITS